MLEVFGVEPDAESVYLAVLEAPGADVGQLADVLGWTAGRVSSAVAQLAELRLVRASWDRPQGVHPVSPALALDGVLAHKRAEVLRQQYEIEEGNAVLDSLAARYDPRRPAFGSSRMLGPDAARSSLEQLAHEARQEVLAFAHPAPASMIAADPLTGQLLNRGVSVRVILSDSARTDPDLGPQAQHMKDLGIHLRTVPELPVPMMIVDRSQVMLPADPREPAIGVSIHRGAGVLAAVCALFQQYWRVATPWVDRCLPAHVPIDQERALLRLLREGMTDEQAGRRLGVSVRTVGRMVSAVMRRLGARSRFQAGMLVERMGPLAQGPDGQPT